MKKQKKKYDYFEGLEELVGYSFETAKVLRSTLDNFQEGITAQQIKDVHEIEHQGDIKKHDMMNFLMREFITPIEREDIVSISQGIDDVTDAIEDVLIKMYMFHIKKPTPTMIEFSELILRCCKATRKVMKEFSGFKKPAKLHELIIDVNSLENEGDDLYTNAIRRLYGEELPAPELLAVTEIYQSMENCLDAMEEVTSRLELVVMKNS